MLTTWNDPRNLRDCYKWKEQEQIKADRQKRVLPLVVALMNLTGDFNKSSAIRNANNFLASEVVIVGKKKWDRRGAVGAYHYMNVSYAADISELYARFKGYTFVALENVADATPIEKYQWEPSTVMLFGEEEQGLDAQSLAYCDEIVTLPTLGTVRSLNVSTASGIAMFDYCQKVYSMV